MDTLDYSGGWADPARQGATAFRAILDAMARPGRIVTLAGVTPPPGLSAAAAAVLLTLTDAEARVWLAPSVQPAAPWLRFHTNAPQGTPAMFACGSWAELMPLEQWPAGDPAYPDRSTTLIVEVASLTAGPAMTLTGPGIQTAAALAPDLPPGAAALLRANAARFPLGLDLIFAAGDRLAALPRSTRIGA